MFESLRTEDFCYTVSLVLRIMNFITHKGEISLSNLSGYGLAILGAAPNISLVFHKHVDNDMRTIEAYGPLRSQEVATSARRKCQIIGVLSWRPCTNQKIGKATTLVQG